MHMRLIFRAYSREIIPDCIPGNLSRDAGFTIVEIVAVILVSAVMAAGVVTYISRASEGVVLATELNQLSSAGRMAINRLAMELHNSLPNSIRTSPVSGGDQCIEFIPVRAATSYINPPFSGSGSTTFDVVDFTPSQHGISGGFAVIYPRNQSQIFDGDNGAVYANWPNFPNRRPIQEIQDIQDSASVDQSTVTLVTAHRFNRRSPNQRFFVVEQPVSYCVVGDKLYRYSDYGFFASQVTEEESGTCSVTPDPPDRCLPNYAAGPARKKVLITDSIDNSGITAFSIGTQSLQRNSLVKITFNMSNGVTSITLNHEVLTRSTP